MVEFGQLFSPPLIVFGVTAAAESASGGGIFNKRYSQADGLDNIHELSFTSRLSYGYFPISGGDEKM